MPQQGHTTKLYPTFCLRQILLQSHTCQFSGTMIYMHSFVWGAESVLGWRGSFGMFSNTFGASCYRIPSVHHHQSATSTSYVLVQLCLCICICCICLHDHITFMDIVCKESELCHYVLDNFTTRPSVIVDLHYCLGSFDVCLWSQYHASTHLSLEN